MSNTNYVKYEDGASKIYGLYKKLTSTNYYYALLFLERLEADGMLKTFVDDVVRKAIAERMAISAADEVMDYVKGKES